MTTESDPYVIYGGEPSETTKVDDDCPSLGAMAMADFKIGDNKACFINGITKETWTYKDLLEQTTLLARVLHGAGIRPNDVVSILSENRLEFPAIVFGAFYLKAIVAPINTTYTERELKHSLQLSKPRFIFTTPSKAEQILKVCKNLKFVERVIVFGREKLTTKTISYSDFIQKYEKKDFNVENYVAQRVSRDQVAYIASSSGTTGLPKAVLITQMNIMSVVQGIRDSITLAKLMLGGTVISSSCAPWFHSMGFFAMTINACSRDGTFVFLPKFENESFLRCIQEYKIASVSIVPPIMVFLAKDPVVDKYDLSSLINIACGAATLSKEVEDQVRDRFRKNHNTEIMIRQAYGMSESTLRTIASTLVVKPGSVGQVLPEVYCKVVDENGKSLGPNLPGELCFKGPVIMKGYLNDADATKNAVDKNGWLHTGDIGYYDEDKHFFIVDRLKELIKYNAYQVAPAELEALLLSNPKVKDCCVIGIPDEKSGELPFAYVVKQPGIELTDKEIIQFVADNTSKVKQLRGGARFVDEIPRNASGKILRRQMREMYRASKSKL